MTLTTDTPARLSTRLTKRIRARRGKSMVLLICFMLEKTKLLQRFSKWPLHITLIPWFRLNTSDLPRFINLLERTAKAFGQVAITTSDINYFGSKKPIRVIELERTSSLIKLHEALLLGINEITTLENGAYTGKDFRPHITLGKDREPPKQKQITFDQLYIIAKYELNQRQVVEIIKLPRKSAPGRM